MRQSLLLATFSKASLKFFTSGSYGFVFSCLSFLSLAVTKNSLHLVNFLIFIIKRIIKRIIGRIYGF